MLSVPAALLLGAGSLLAQEPSFLNPDPLIAPARPTAEYPASSAGAQPQRAAAPRQQRGATAITGAPSVQGTGLHTGEPVAREAPDDAPVALEVGETDAVPGAPAPTPASATPVPRDQTKVAVLGYHNFSETRPVSEMCMRTSDFRKQMEYLRQAGIAVIGMQDFLDWRFGTKQLPERCALITIDDGWKSAYTDAFSILREYGYPFTLFLYTQFLTGRGDAMSHEMVREMARYGATIGSHSTSHLYPRSWKRAGQGTPAYTALIDKEIGASARKLEELFGGKVTTYCYPGGYHTPEMIERARQYGYVAAFTVIPRKVRYDENPFLIHRYMIFGNNHRIFHMAMNFSDESTSSAASATGARISAPPPPFEVVPAAHATVSCDVPVVTADLSAVQGLLPRSVMMKVSGFGHVPCRVDANKIVSWSPPTRLYMPDVTILLSWKTVDSPARHSAVWSFKTGRAVTPDPQNQ